MKVPPAMQSETDAAVPKELVVVVVVRKYISMVVPLDGAEQPNRHKPTW